MDDVRPLGHNDYPERLAALHRRDEELHLFEFWGDDTADQHQGDQAALRRQARRRAVSLALPRHRAVPARSREAGAAWMSERRSLIMVNPALKPLVATVTTLFAAYRINVPHEIMPPHRHSPNAIRFGITGSTNFTGVEGENITFGPGDLVLTPHDTWHNHGNGPDDASVNLSVLDMPLVNILNATYFEHDYTEEEGGKVVAKRIQSAKLPDDYSQRAYGSGGLMPRFLDHRRGAGT